MRTTIDIDDDVIQAAREIARQEHVTIGQVVSGWGRQVLSEPSPSSEEFLGFRPLPKRGVIVTNEIVNRIREEEGI
jgi:hypothetical protein